MSHDITYPADFVSSDQRPRRSILMTDTQEFTIKCWSPVDDASNAVRYLTFGQSSVVEHKNFTIACSNIDELERVGEIIAAEIKRRREFEPPIAVDHPVDNDSR